jgi:hypothetical protein
LFIEPCVRFISDACGLLEWTIAITLGDWRYRFISFEWMGLWKGTGMRNWKLSRAVDMVVVVYRRIDSVNFEGLI